MQITRLYRYPVKSLRGIEEQQASLGMRGVQYDRSMMLVNAEGEFVTQRQFPWLARFSVALNDHDEGTLAISLFFDNKLVETGILPKALSLVDVASYVRVSIWGKQLTAERVLPELTNAIQHLSRNWTNQSFRLVRVLESEAGQPVSPDRVGAGVFTGFSDGYPVLVASEASLDDLNQNLEHAVPMERFRPNLVVDTLSSWEEERLAGLVLESGYRLKFTKPCERCSITTLDHLSGETPVLKEPLKTLTRLSRGRGHRVPVFGMNAVLCHPDGKTVRVDDEYDQVLLGQGEVLSPWFS